MNIEALGRFIVARASEDEEEALAVATSAAGKGRPGPAMEWEADGEVGYILLGHSRAFAITTVILRVLWERCGDDWTSVTPEQEELARLLAHPWRHHPDFDTTWAYRFPRPPGASEEDGDRD